MQPTAVAALLQSKKFLASALASGLSAFLLYKGLGLEQIAIVTAPLYTFVGGQAVADIGKERAKAEAAKAQPVTITGTSSTSSGSPPQP